MFALEIDSYFISTTKNNVKYYILVLVKFLEAILSCLSKDNLVTYYFFRLALFYLNNVLKHIIYYIILLEI